MSDSSFTFWFFDITRFIQSDYPTILRRISFSELVNAGTYEVPTENTYTNNFSIKYPKYSLIIDNASNPSLNADYYVTKITLGKTWGIFYP